MVANNNQLTHAKAEGTVAHVPSDTRQKAVMHHSRPVAQTGQFPTVAKENSSTVIACRAGPGPIAW